MAEEKAKAKEAKEAEKAPKSKSKKVETLIGEVESLSVLELADLVKALEEKFGVSATPVVAAPATAPPAQEAAPAEVKSTFTVVLTDAGSQKIQVIKALRTLDQNLGLKEAKDKVEAAPVDILLDVKKEPAEEAKKLLEAAGAKVELK